MNENYLYSRTTGGSDRLSLSAWLKLALTLGWCLLMGSFVSAQNDPPVVSGPLSDLGLPSGFVNYVMPIQDVFSDPNGDPLTITGVSDNTAVAVATVAGTNLFLAEVGLGDIIITLTASDPDGASTSHSFMVTVGVTNNDPELLVPIADKEYRAGFVTDTQVLESLFGDQDGDNLSYSVTSSDESVVEASIVSSILILREKGSGTADVQLMASDGKGGQATTTFTVTIKTNNIPIVRSRVLDNVFNEGFGSSTIDFEGVFVDADDDPLTLSAESNDEGVAMGEFDGTDLVIFEFGIGEATITVSAQDDFGGLSTTSFKVTINPLNEAPFIAFEIEDQTYDKGFNVAMINLSSTFIDPEDEVLSYTVTSSDPEVIAPVTSGDTLYLKEGREGTTRITVVAKDPAFHRLEISFSVRIVQPNRAPTANEDFKFQTLEQGFDEVFIPMEQIFSDPDGDSLMYDASSSDERLVTARIVNGDLLLREGEGFGIVTLFLTAEDERGAIVDLAMDMIVRRSAANDVVLSTEEVAPEALTVYPNPTHGRLVLEHISFVPERVQVIDYSGRALGIRTTREDSKLILDLTGLDAGMYWVLVTGGSQQVVEKVVKK